MPRRLRYGDLPNDPPQGVCMACPSCCQTFSANRRDYWSCEDDSIAICGTCDEPLVLVQRSVRYVRVPLAPRSRKAGAA